MDLKQYFKKKGKSIIFIGDTLEIFVPDRYTTHGYLDITNSVKTIGIFDMQINGKIDTGYLLAGVIEILPSEISTTNIDGQKFHKLLLNKNDVFIKDDKIVGDEKIQYVVFYEMIFGGHYPQFMKYKDVATLFDNVLKATGGSFNTDHMILEMIAATLFRSKKDPTVEYRLTDMKDDPYILPLRSIGYVAKSTTGKILGNYMNEGVDSVLVNTSNTPSEIEDLLRK